jgi:hypothetical protein
MIREYPLSQLRSYSTKGKLSFFPVQASKGNYLFNVRAYNNSGSTQNVGIMVLTVNGEYSLYTYLNSGPTYTNVTASISSGVNILTANNNDGFVVQSNYPIGMIGMTVSTGSSGAGTITYGYWNGSSFSSLTTLENPANYESTGDAWIVFQPPQGWVVGGPTGTNQSKYSIFVQATTNPGSVVTITNLWTAYFLELVEGVANNAYVQLTFPDSKPYLTSSGAGIIPYFSVPNAANQMAAFLAITG